MVKKGVGTYQLDQSATASQTIVRILSDGKWHRYQELKQTSKLSSATLSKHLKELEEGIVEKKMLLESGEYPYPVVYKIKEKNQAPIKKIVDSVGYEIFTVIRFTRDGLKLDMQKKLKDGGTGLIEAISKATKIYVNDNNWKAFEQTTGIAIAFYNDFLHAIVKKNTTDTDK